MSFRVRLGFVPSYRFRWSAWTQSMRDESIAALGAVAGVEVVAPEGGVRSLDEAEETVELFARERVDGVVLCPTDFGDERSACKVAERLGAPVLLYATKEPAADPGPSLARVSDSYCGNLSIAAGLHRRGIPFRFAGLFLPGDDGLAREFEAFARAVSVIKGFRNARIGQIGVRPPTFETVAYDEVAMARKFGQNVIFADLSEIVADAKRRADDDPAVAAVAEDIRGSVREVTVGDDYLLNAAKLELALVGFAERSGVSALAMQCWPAIQRALGISACAVFGRLTERGILAACEADVLGALSMLASYRAALGRVPPHFIDWTIRHRDDTNLLLAWHCGNAPVCLAAVGRPTALRSRSDMVGQGPPGRGDAQAGLFQFQLKLGTVTFCRIAEYDGEWKMLIARGDIEQSDEVHSGTWSWVRVPDHDRLYRTLVEEGFIHHASMTHGDQIHALRQACLFLGVQPVVVE